MPSKPSSKKPPQLRNLSFEAIGTHWQITTPTPLPEQALDELFTTIQQFDCKWSRFRTDSRVTQLAQTAGTLPLDPDEAAMWQLYRELYEMSSGAITPLVGQTLVDAGYDSSYSLAPAATLSPAPDWDATLALHDTSVTVLQPVLLDIGAAGKGLLVDRVAAVVGSYAKYATVDAGGDIYVSGHGERIALEHPLDSRRALGVATLREAAVCGSASNRRAWAGLHHIFDARTTQPTAQVIATWAVAASAMRADLLATALFFVDPAQLPLDNTINYVALYADGSLRYATHQEIELYV